MSVADVQSRRDPEATRASILDAAEIIFAERGFAATSMSEIATRADVTKSLIHHHFGSKVELWNAVKKRRLSEFAEGLELLLATEQVDEKLLAESVSSFFRFLEGHPGFVRLNAWMSLEDPQLSVPAKPELIEVGVERLRQAQREGHLRRDVAPWHILTFFISLCMYWFMNPNAAGRRQMADSDPETANDRYLEDMLKIFLEGVVARS